MRKSTNEEIQTLENLVTKTRDAIRALIEDGRHVHAIFDFDGVLGDSRSDDVFALSKHNLEKYFEHEERMLLELPGRGPWLPLVHHPTGSPHFKAGCFTFDIVSARSSTLAMRVHLFSMMWNLNPRWMLFIGHQSKKESYRIILKSFRHDRHAHVFCIDDNASHVNAFLEASQEECMEARTRGIVSPVVRTYGKKELKEYLARVMGTEGKPIRVRDPADDIRGFTVLPGGTRQFKPYMESLVSNLVSESHHQELRAAFIKVHGEVGEGTFKSEEKLEQAMREFILGIACP